jgi:hypothetical protein
MVDAAQRLLSAEELLEALFPETSRPSLRWLRTQQKRRSIPFIKIGHLVRFDPALVRAALNDRHTVNAKAVGND